MTSTKPDVSEVLATLALTIKIAQYVGESMGYRAEFVRLFDLASLASVVLFGCSVVLWLRASREKLRKVDLIADRMQQINAHMDQLDVIARYGRAPVHLARLQSQGQEWTHGRAGGETLTDALLEVYGRAAEGLYNMTRGSSESVVVSEYHLVDRFLENLIKNLPAGSVWLGVTKLQNADAWTKGFGEEAYLRFQELVERQTRRHAIHFFRLWCFDDANRRDMMMPVLATQLKAGLHIRSIISAEIPDMSLIWIPRVASDKIASNGDLRGLLDSINSDASPYQPLCAIEFTARGGRELDKMTIHAPGSEQFTTLRLMYTRSWDRAAQLAVAEA